MDVVAGFAKGCFLLIAVLVIVYKAIDFLLSPAEIPGFPVLITATLALLVNLVTALWLKADACHSLNGKRTYLCMVYDAVGSAAVMISAVLTLLFGILYFDVVASAVIVLLMVRSATVAESSAPSRKSAVPSSASNTARSNPSTIRTRLGDSANRRQPHDLHALTTLRRC